MYPLVILCICYLQEYESQSSAEARLVKQFDLLEMILQAHEYEELEETPGRLQEFFDSTNGTTHHPRCAASELKAAFFNLCVSSGRFYHPDVLRLVSSLNEERGRHMTDFKDAKKSESADAGSDQPHTSHVS